MGELSLAVDQTFVSPTAPHAKLTPCDWTQQIPNRTAQTAIATNS